MIIRDLFNTCAIFEKICTAEAEEANPFTINPPADPTAVDPVTSSVNSIKLPNGEEITQEDIKTLSKYKPELGDEFWKKFVEMSIDVSPSKTKKDVIAVANLIASVIRHESGFDPRACARNAKTKNPIAKGLNQFIVSTAVSSGMTKEQWGVLETPAGLSAIQQLPFMGNFFKKCGIRAGMTISQVRAKNFGDGHVAQNGKDQTGSNILYSAQNQANEYNTNVTLDVTLGPDGKIVLGPDGQPVRKGYISEHDLSPEVERARYQLSKKK